MRFNKICDARDWDDQDFKIINNQYNPKSPKHRKFWEIMQCDRVIHALVPYDSYGLGLACGSEKTMHALAQDYKVIATDLYGQDSQWLTARMDLKDVYTCTGINYPIRNFIAMYMDMRDVMKTFQPSTFDFVWSLCSIEHLDTIQEVLDVIQGVYNILVSGGIFFFTTEWFLFPPYDRYPGAICFNHDILPEIERIGFQFFDIEGIISASKVTKSIQQDMHIRNVHNDNRIREVPILNEEEKLPHISIKLKDGRCVTSVSFCLQKPRGV